MANDNEFSFGNLGKDYEDRKVNSDYLDLLSETKVSESEVRREAHIYPSGYIRKGEQLHTYNAYRE